MCQFSANVYKYRILSVYMKIKYPLDMWGFTLKFGVHIIHDKPVYRLGREFWCGLKEVIVYILIEEVE